MVVEKEKGWFCRGRRVPFIPFQRTRVSQQFPQPGCHLHESWRCGTANKVNLTSSCHDCHAPEHGTQQGAALKKGHYGTIVLREVLHGCSTVLWSTAHLLTWSRSQEMI
jgi:hypothetical protein